MLFKVIQEYLDYCNLVEENTKEVVRLRVDNFKTITEQLIPFFTKNSLQSKLLNFIDFCKACALIKEKAHLTEKGVTTLKTIKLGMNTGRKYTKYLN